MKKLLVSIALLLVIATACTPGSSVQVNTPESSVRLTTPGPNPELNTRAPSGHVANFLDGLWHGIISPITTIGAFFNPALQMYEVHNNGREYNLGFLIGVAVVFLVLGVLGGRR